ncbi:MAG: prolyl oligopeptidase family serine peptidase [Bacteroidales bacterium]
MLRLKINHIFLFLFLFLFIAGCNKPINYPYAENNITESLYHGVLIQDEYEWLDARTESNQKKKVWLSSQQELANTYFADRDTSVRKRINQLASVPQYHFIDMMNDTLYYFRSLPFSKIAKVYKYDQNQKRSHYIQTVTLPFTILKNPIFRLSPDLKYLACLGGIKGTCFGLFIFDLTKSDDEAPVCVVPGVLNQKFYWTRDGKILYKEDPVYDVINKNLTINRVMILDVDKNTTETLYENDVDDISALIDLCYDHSSNTAFLGKYTRTDRNYFKLYKINMNDRLPKLINKMPMPDSIDIRLCDADTANAYLISRNHKRYGELLSINLNSGLVDTLIYRHWMPISGFALTKTHVLTYFQDFRSNRAYAIEKSTKKLKELPIKDSDFHTFITNKDCSNLYFQRENPVHPRFLYSMDLNYSGKTHLLGTVNDLPFDPDQYKVEYLSVKGKKGENINLTVTYKKGLKKDSSNPLFLTSYLNAENSYLDQFNFMRMLYMDYGFVFVQRSFADTRKTISLNDRIDDMESVIQALIKEQYTTEDKIAILGREYGATAAMALMNRWPGLNARLVLIDGLFDLIKYDQTGRLLFQNNRLFTIDSAEDFQEMINVSPYHNVKRKGKYPPILVLSTLEQTQIPPSHSYKLVAKMQMRTQGKNPIILYSPHTRIQDQSNLDYRDYIELAFTFLVKNMSLKKS